MKITIIKETVNDYKKTALLIGVKTCDYKCCIEQNIDNSICHNYNLDNEEEVDLSTQSLISRVLKNKLINAVIFGGKEPMLDKYFNDMLDVIECLRDKSEIDIVIYTGYYKHEISEKIEKLKKFNNIIVKFGRFKLNGKKRFDNVLGIELNNEEQYAEKIS